MSYEEIVLEIKQPEIVKVALNDITYNHDLIFVMEYNKELYITTSDCGVATRGTSVKYYWVSIYSPKNTYIFSDLPNGRRQLISRSLGDNKKIYKCNSKEEFLELLKDKWK